MELAMARVHVTGFEGRVKRLVVKASLQSVKKQNSTTLLRMFSWCNQNISGISSVLYPVIFFLGGGWGRGGAGFFTSVVKRKTVLQLGSLGGGSGGTVSLPQWGPWAKRRKTLAILHSE